MMPHDRMRLERGAGHLHTLGPRPTVEILATLAERIGGAPALLGLLAEYERLTPNVVWAVRGDGFPPPPLHLVEQSA